MKKNNIKLHVWIIMPSQKIFPAFKLMDIHGDNSLKQEFMAPLHLILKNFPTSLQIPLLRKIASIKGFGDSTAKKIAEMLETASLGFK
jgi:hypothetical protein